MKIVLNYDPVSGQITDKNNTYIWCQLGLSYELPESIEFEKTKTNAQQMIDLKNAGFSVKEIFELKKAKLL